jgi:hypothetical protein
MVTIPNQYCKLIDCGRRKVESTNDIKTMLTWTNDHSNTMSLVPLFSHVHDRSFVLDTSTGRLYRYSLNKNLFYHHLPLEWISWLIDFQTNVDDYISAQLIQEHDSTSLTIFFKQYILSSSYLESVERLEKDFLPLVPNTCTQLLILEAVRNSTPWNLVHHPPHRYQRVEEHSEKKSPHTPTMRSPLVSSQLSVNDSYSDDTSLSSRSVHSEDDYSLSYKYVFYVCLRNCIKRLYGKPWLAKRLSTIYTNILFDKLRSLLALTGTDYHTLSCFFMAIEDLGLPPPPGFHHAFIQSAFNDLPKREFVQCVMRDMFIITPEFIDQVRHQSDNHMVQLLNRYMYKSHDVDYDKEVSQLRYKDHDENKSLLLSHYDRITYEKRTVSSQVSSPMYDTDETDDDDDVFDDEKCFSPLKHFLDTPLDGIDKALMHKYSHRLLRKNTPFV